MVCIKKGMWFLTYPFRDDKVEEKKVDILPKSNVPEHIYKVEETMEDSKVVVKAVLEKHIYKHNKYLILKYHIIQILWKDLMV